MRGTMRRTLISAILTTALLIWAILQGSPGTVGLADRCAEYELALEGYREDLRYARASGDALHCGSVAEDARMNSLGAEAPPVHRGTALGSVVGELPRKHRHGTRDL